MVKLTSGQIVEIKSLLNITNILKNQLDSIVAASERKFPRLLDQESFDILVREAPSFDKCEVGEHADTNDIWKEQITSIFYNLRESLTAACLHKYEHCLYPQRYDRNMLKELTNAEERFKARQGIQFLVLIAYLCNMSLKNTGKALTATQILAMSPRGFGSWAASASVRGEAFCDTLVIQLKNRLKYLQEDKNKKISKKQKRNIILLLKKICDRW